LRSNINSFEKKSDEYLEVKIRDTNLHILRMNSKSKIILEMFANSQILDVDKKIDMLEEEYNMTNIYRTYTELYAGLIKGVESALLVFNKIIKIKIILQDFNLVS